MDIVITTIFPPSEGARQIAAKLEALGTGTLWVMGDRKGPKSYDLPRTRFVDIDAQLRLPFHLAKILPERHYTRKNLGYLLAVQQRLEALVETDDDNIPLPDFWQPRQLQLAARQAAGSGWCNAYAAFTPLHIWPRGLPLEQVRAAATTSVGDTLVATECLIQQHLANQNPDVDAVYRLILPLPFDFEDRPPVALGRGVWCPFNTQNTTYFRPAFPLLYLPTHCPFRMTDIWRSLVAQRCLWEMDGRVAFARATVYQERNEHRLLDDFEQEIPGYLKNERIRLALEGARLQPGRDWATLCANLITCYEALVREGILPAAEMPLLEAWNRDILALA